ncbi:MAG: site-specific integrase [Epsilonproteobacteria bacterium]|nr:site-specific integrase [Campylobacterota bacterium]
MGVCKLINSKRYGGKIKINILRNGDITYYATIKINGKKKIVSIGKKSNGWTEKKAFDQRAKLLNKAKHGLSVNSGHVTVGDLATEYFEHSYIHNRSHKKVVANYNKHIASRFDKKIVGSLIDKDIERLKKSLQDKNLSKGTIDQYVSILTRIINYGIKEGIIDHSPFRNIKKFRENNNRDRFLTRKESNELLDRLKKEDNNLYLFVLLSLNLGARATSILNIKMSDVDFENGKVRIFDFKRHMYYKNPLNNQLRDALKDINHGSFIVGNSSKMKYVDIYNKMKPILDSMFNIDILKTDRKSRVVIHTFRHTFASHLALQNTPLQNIQQCMNHADIKMTLKYAHLMPNAGDEFVDT